MGGHVEVEIPDPNSETQKIFDRLEEKLIVKGRILRSIAQNATKLQLEV